MKKTELFACPLLHYDVPFYADIKKKFVSEIYTLREQQQTNVISNRAGGWQSPPVPPMQKTLRMIVADICTHMRQTMLNAGNEIYIQSLWYNINSPGAYNDYHDHPRSHMAGVFYCHVPEGDAGNIVLLHPNQYQWSDYLLGATDGKEQSLYHEIQPVEGRFILFPSSVFHRVMPNNTDDDRISFACNLNIGFK